MTPSPTRTTNRHAHRRASRSGALLTMWLFLAHIAVPPLNAAYGLNYVVADLRQPASRSGNTACPQRTHIDLRPRAALAGSGARRLAPAR
jgi:hypothetical protein